MEYDTTIDENWENVSQGMRNDSFSVGTSSTVILPANPRRRSFAIVNSSSDDTKTMTIHFGSAVAVANKGLVLFQRQSYAESDGAGFFCFKGEITAICAVASGQLSIIERSY